MKNQLKALAAGAVALATTGTLMAVETGPSVDTAQIEAYINDEMIVALAAVGGVIILASVVAVSFKWIKGMLFG